MADDAYGTYRPPESATGTTVALCVLCDDKNTVLTGQYRLCFNGVAPVRFDVDLMSILGKDPIPECLLTIVKYPRELYLKENGSVSSPLGNH